MAARQGGAGAFGPYKHKRRFRILLRRDPGSAGSYLSFATKPEAERQRKLYDAEIKATRERSQRSIADAIEAYELHLADEGHRQAGETIRRINGFFVDVLELAIGDLHADRCQQIYDEVRKRKATRWVGSGKGRRLVELDETIATDTHRGMLTHARTFIAWCVAKKWLRANPLAAVKGKGRLRKHGKRQLRIDEARKWFVAAAKLAPKKPGAVAALCAVVLALRASEIISRQVRDLDDEGRILWVEETDDFDVKTEDSRRQVEVPDLLRPALLALAKGRAGDELLFGADARGRAHKRGWPLYWVKQICKAAKVPAVNAHSMRGLHTTLAVQAGATTHLVAQAIGHGNDGVTIGSYIDPKALAKERQRKAMQVIRGGKK